MKLMLLFIALFAFNLKIFAQADKILGVWLAEEKDGKVEIYKKDNKYYGKIVWIDEKNYENGQPKKDIKNPNIKLRNRSVLNLEILKNFNYDKDDNEWTDGEIYDPKNGSTYSSYMWHDEKNPNILNIRGYIGFSLIGRTTIWTRSKL